MPINSAFKRSLLNSQPIVKKNDGIVSTSHDPDDGYAGVNCGFVELIEKQEKDEIESVSTTETEYFDSNYNIGGKKPEIILTLQPSAVVPTEENDYKRLISIIEELDYKDSFLNIVKNSSSNTIEKIVNRINEVNNQIEEIGSSLDELANLVESRDRYFMSLQLIKNKENLNKLTAEYRKKHYNKYSEDPYGKNIDISSTLLGFEDFENLSNTTLVYMLCILSTLPGTAILETGAYADENLTRYQKLHAIKIKRDEVSDYLQSMSETEYILSLHGFMKMSKILPNDKIQRLSMLAEAMSYEFKTTRGLKANNRNNIFDILKNDVGHPDDDLSLYNQKEGSSIRSMMVNNSITILEPDEKEINSTVRINGLVQSLIDPKIKDATFDFTKLQKTTTDFTNKLSSYIQQVKKLRMIEDSSDFFDAQNLISEACLGILDVLKNFDNRTLLNKNDVQFALLCEISKNKTEKAIRAKRIIFKEIFNVSEEENSRVVDRNGYLRPTKANDAPVRVRPIVPDVLSDIGTSKLVSTIFSLNEEKIKIENSSSYSTNLSTISDITINNADPKTKRQYSDILKEQIILNEDARFKGLKLQSGIKERLISSNLRGTSLLGYDIKYFYKNFDKKYRSILEESGPFVSSLSFNNNSALKKKFEDMKLSDYSFATSEAIIPVTQVSGHIFGTTSTINTNLSVTPSWSMTVTTPSTLTDTNNDNNFVELSTSTTTDSRIQGIADLLLELFELNPIMSSATLRTNNQIMSSTTLRTNNPITSGATLITNNPIASSAILRTGLDRDAPSPIMLVYRLEAIDDSIYEILKDNEGFSSIKKQLITLCDEIYSRLNIRFEQTVNNIKAITRSDKTTSNYDLSYGKVKFLIFEMFMSILANINSTSVTVEEDAEVDNSRSRHLIVSIDQTEMLKEIDELKNITSKFGTEENISYGISRLKNIVSSMGICSNSNDLVINRISMLEAILNVYSNATNDFLKISSKKNVLKTINNMSDKGDVFSNLTKENISSKKSACLKVLSRPMSIPSSVRIQREYSFYSKLFESNLAQKHATIIAVGMPSMMSEFLESNARKNYVEIRVSKKSTLYPDFTLKDTVVRFCKFLNVIPKISEVDNLLDAANNFHFLCYENGDWNTKSVDSAVRFVSKVTGLDYGNSKVIVINHVFDALAKYYIYNKTGIFIDDLLHRKEFIRVSGAGRAILNSIAFEQQPAVFGSLNLSDILEDRGDGYYIKKFSELGESKIDKTDQPTHRLLNEVMSDSLFTIESLKKCILSSQSFERIYCIGLSSEELNLIDKDKSEYIKELAVTIDSVSN